MYDENMAKSPSPMRFHSSNGMPNNSTSAYSFNDHRIDAIRLNLNEVYGENAVLIDPLHSIKRIPTERHGREFGHIGYSESHFGAPARVYVAENVEETFIIKFLSSENLFHGNDAGSNAGCGKIVPARRIVGIRDLAYESVHINTRKIRELCSWWLGRELDAAPTFEARPFSGELGALWTAVTTSMASLMSVESLPDLAINNLTDYAISLLIQFHPHDYSHEISCARNISRKQFNQAKEFIVEKARDAITHEDVAAHVDCSIASLSRSFVRFDGVTPRQALYRERMEHARKELETGLAPDDAWIRSHGFLNTDRFRLEYRSRYGESLEDARGNGRAMSNSLHESSASDHHGLSREDIGELLLYIRKALTEKITLEGLAKLAGTSKNELIAAFRNHLGMTPIRCVIIERIHLVKQRLASTSQPLVDIAMDAGFNSQSHMATTFRKEVGMSPGDYRKRCRTEEFRQAHEWPGACW